MTNGMAGAVRGFDKTRLAVTTMMAVVAASMGNTWAAVQ